jgi:hypothetical protein
MRVKGARGLHSRRDGKFRLIGPMTATQRAANLFEFSYIGSPRPIMLDRLFEFPPGADAGKSQVRRNKHQTFLLSV